MGAWEDGFAAGWDKAMEVASRLGPRFIEPEARRSRAVRAPARPKRTRAPSAYNKRLGRALKKYNKMARLKSGAYRKAWSAKRVMKLAHKEAKK